MEVGEVQGNANVPPENEMPRSQIRGICRQSRLSRVATTTDSSRQQTATTLADLVWGFFRPAAVRPVGVGLGIFPAGGAAVRPVGVGLGIFPAGGGPAGRRWIGDFPDIRAVSAGSSGSSSAAHLYRTFFYRVPVVPHIFL